jgi:hypothetical protein
MAFAPNRLEDNRKLLGQFTEKEFGKHFEYVENDELVFHVPAHGGKQTRFPHLIFVGPNGEETRRALVKGSVAHVVTDERTTPDGRDFFVVEKWDIKSHRVYR